MWFDSERIAERKIQEAIEEGVFDNLPDKGKPIRIDDTPLEMRLLKNAGVLPDWILLDKEIDEERRACARYWKRLEREYAAFQTRWMKATTPHVSETPQAVRRAYAAWRERSRDAYISSCRQVNNDILKLSMKAPRSVESRIPFRIIAEEARFDAAFPVDLY